MVLSAGDGGDVFSAQLRHNGRLGDRGAVETLSELSVDAVSPGIDVSSGGETSGVRSSGCNGENGDVFHRRDLRITYPINSCDARGVDEGDSRAESQLSLLSVSPGEELTLVGKTEHVRASGGNENGEEGRVELGGEKHGFRVVRVAQLLERVVSPGVHGKLRSQRNEAGT